MTANAIIDVEYEQPACPTKHAWARVPVEPTSTARTNGGWAASRLVENDIGVSSRGCGWLHASRGPDTGGPVRRDCRSWADWDGGARPVRARAVLVCDAHGLECC